MRNSFVLIFAAISVQDFASLTLPPFYSTIVIDDDDGGIYIVTFVICDENDNSTIHEQNIFAFVNYDENDDFTFVNYDEDDYLGTWAP